MSAIYRVPFQNIVGDIGFYIYQQVYPFYGIAISMATYGFPVIISKLYAEKISTGKKEEADRLLLPAFLSVLLFCFILFLLIHHEADRIAMIMGDHELAAVIRTVSYSFLFVPAISVLRGFFQGKGNMTPTAISQVGEQFVRVSFILVSAVLLISYNFNLYDVGRGAIVSSIIGSFIGIIILTFFFLKHRKWKLGAIRFHFQENWFVAKNVLIQGTAICISSMTLLLFQMSDAFQIVSILVDGSVPLGEAQVIKGVYDRGQPLLQLGLVLATSLSLAVVPLVTVMKSKGQDIHDYVNLALRISLSVGAAATLGLILIMNSVNTMLFQNDDGSNVLRILVLAILLTSIVTTVISVLHGLGNTFYPSVIVVLGLIIKMVGNQLFIEQWGIYGAPIATNIALFIMLLLLLLKLHKYIGFHQLQFRYFSILGISLSTMAVIILLFLAVSSFIKPAFANFRLYSSLESVIAALLGGAIFILLLIRKGAFTEDELDLLPLGSKLKVFLANKK